jgi:hypothetical protein
MTATVDELCAMIEAKEIMDKQTETRDPVSRCCRFLRESGLFDLVPSYCKIGSILGLDAETGWTHWVKFQCFGLGDGRLGRL